MRSFDDVLAAGLLDPALADEAERADVVAQRREHDVLADAALEQHAELLAVLGEVADAEAGGLGRVADRHLAAADADDARRHAVGADDRARDLGASRAHEPGEAEDLALAQLERDVAQQVLGRQALDRERDRRIGDAARRPRLAVDLAADHERDDLSRLGVLRDRRVPTLRPSRSTVMRSEMRLSSGIRCEM